MPGAGVPAPGSRGALAAVALGLALGIAALLFDAEPLWVPAGALVTLAVVSAGWVVLAARQTSVTRTVGARRVQEGEELPVVIEVRAAGLPFPGGVVSDELVRRPVELRAGGRGVRVDGRARFARRGVQRLQPTAVVIADPLGLSARGVRGGTAAEVLILPRIEPVLASAAGGEVGAPARRRVMGLAATDVDGVGPLRDGTPASRVYWPALARGGDALERRFRPDGDGRPLVALDPRAPAREEDLDAAVRATASLAVHLAGHGGCWLLVPGARRPAALDQTLAGWPALHARLALVTEHTAPALTATAGRQGTVVLVSAAMRERPPAATGGAVGVLVVPGSLASRRPAFHVAGCQGYRLGRPSRRAVAGATR
jgi:uncharacterized protein (DUF58 family)